MLFRSMYEKKFITNSLIHIDESLDEEIKKLLIINNKIWLKHIRLYIDDFHKKEYKKKQYRTFNGFSIKRFNNALKDLNETIFSKDYSDEWSKFFIHRLRSKIMLMKSFIEQYANDSSLITKQKMIAIIDLYHVWLSFIADDIKYMHKERIEQIITINKAKINES